MLRVCYYPYQIILINKSHEEFQLQISSKYSQTLSVDFKGRSYFPGLIVYHLNLFRKEPFEKMKRIKDALLVLVTEIGLIIRFSGKGIQSPRNLQKGEIRSALV